MVGNADPFGEFGDRCVPLREVGRACRRADQRGLSNTASITDSTLSGVRTEGGSLCGLLSFTDPS